MKFGHLCKYLLRKINRRKRFEIIAIILSIYTLMSILWGYLDKDEQIQDFEVETPPKRPLKKNLEYIERPTIIYWTEDDNRETKKVCDSKCDIWYGHVKLPPNTRGAYLFYASRVQFSNLPLPRYPNTVIWGLMHEESPRNVAELMHEKILNVFNYSSTFSRYSDVPYPLQSIISLENITSTIHYVETKQKNLLLKELAPILFLQTDCDTSTEREKYVKALQEFQRIDSYGSCLNNKELPKGVKGPSEDYLNSFDEEVFLKFVANYKFVIAIENGVCDDYITEKLWRAIHVGVVPIYFGSPTIRDWLPNEKSAILLEDFPTPELLSRHIDILMSNDTLYEEYLEHKTKGKISNPNLSDELRKRPYQTSPEKREDQFVCFLCKKLQEPPEEGRVMTAAHYRCPKPVSALTQRVEKKNVWVESWEFTRRYVVNSLYNHIMGLKPKTKN